MTRNITIKGETRSMSEWGRLNGLSRQTIHRRLKEGWDVDHAVNSPVRVHTKITEPLYVIDGVTDTVAGWCRKYGMASETVRYRLTKGWSIIDALRTRPNRTP